MSTTVLVTGTSSGIGRATARRLAGRNLTVYATARSRDSIADLADCSCRLLELDVTDEDNRRRVVETIEAEQGHVDVLVNNAGYGQYGAVEEVDLGAARRQFETNVFGPVGLASLVLPGMRAAGGGTIVNVSSMGGRFTLPGGGWYHASKHALEALSDALRFEVAPFGVDVVLIEPGLIRTEFAPTAVGTAEDAKDPGGPYAGMVAGVQGRIASSYRRSAAAPEAVAAVIDRAIRARSPRTRYRVTLGARLLLVLRWLLPDRLWDAMLATQFPRPADR